MGISGFFKSPGGRTMGKMMLYQQAAGMSSRVRGWTAPPSATSRDEPESGANPWARGGSRGPFARGLPKKRGFLQTLFGGGRNSKKAVGTGFGSNAAGRAEAGFAQRRGAAFAGRPEALAPVRFAQGFAYPVNMPGRGMVWMSGAQLAALRRYPVGDPRAAHAAARPPARRVQF